jgi:4-hydroxybenzoate polyprenyltransferase
MVALTMYLVRHCLFIELTYTEQTGFRMAHIPFALHGPDFFWLVLSTVFITAAGYVINDMRDIRTDSVNKPARMVVGQTISVKAAGNIYYALNAGGIILAIYCSYQAGSAKLALIHMLAAGLLYFYATSYKGIYLLGNIIVSLLTALVPVLPALYEPGIYNLSIITYIAGYAIFAFLLSLVRELLKDAEDREGDDAAGLRTMAVVSGNRTVKTVSMTLTVLTIALLGVIEYKFMKDDPLSLRYFNFGVQLPMLALIYFIIRARTPRQFRVAANMAKVVMLLGMLSMTVFYYSLASIVQTLHP